MKTLHIENDKRKIEGHTTDAVDKQVWKKMDVKKANEKGNRENDVKNSQLKRTSKMGVLLVEPKSELKFKGPFSKEVAVPMTLKNISTSESVCWKVTTTAPFQYLCRPNKGIIHPQETVSPLVSKQPRDFDPNKIYKDKMRVEAFIVSGKKAKDSNIDKLWQNVDQECIDKKTLKCVLEEPMESSHALNGESEVIAEEAIAAETNAIGNSEMPDCGPCKTDGMKTQASEYCQDCRAFVCASCKSCHNKFDSLRIHSFLPADASAQISLLKTKAGNLSKCNCGNSAVEKYCENHEEIVSMSCADAKHRDCLNCRNITEEWSSNQANIDELYLKINAFESEANNLKYDCNIDFVSEKNRIKAEVEKFKTDLNEWIESLETIFLEELEAKTASDNTLDQMLEDMFKTAKSDIDILRENKDDKMKTFIVTRNISRNMRDCESLLRDVKAGTLPHLVFERNDKLESLMRNISDIGHVRFFPSSLINNI